MIPQPFTFDEATHTYRMENGEILPSVTTVLKDMGFYGNAESWFTEESATRGTYVHRLIQYYLEGTLDFRTIDDGLRPYLDAWQRFEVDTGFSPMEIEKAMASETHRFAGTVDYVGLLSCGPSIIDLKSGAVGPVVGLQTAGYELLLDKPVKRFALQLKDDGRYKLTEFKDRNDRRVFQAALAVWWYQRNNKIR